MKTALTTFLILSFAGIAVFGVFGMMNHNSDPAHTGCIATLAQGTACQKGENAFSFVLFHLGAFKNFSTVVFNASSGSPLLLLLSYLLLFGIATIYGLRLKYPPLTFFPAHQFVKAKDLPLKRELTRWLALHENSPAIF